MLRYILSVEANKSGGWLDADELAVAIDNYQANFSRGKPVAAAIDVSKSSFSASRLSVTRKTRGRLFQWT